MSIYETNCRDCPVRSFISYLSHLHPVQPALWQRPRDHIQPGESIWFCSAPLGEKTLGKMMPKLSLKYGLSERYTNHSIRVTSLQCLEDQNVEGRHIIRISGHKSINSVQNYARRLSASRKRNISASFASHLSETERQETSQPSNSSTANEVVPAATISNNSNDTCENLVEFSNDDIGDSSLSRVSAGILQSLNSFTNCNNCQFTFHVHMHQK